MLKDVVILILLCYYISVEIIIKGLNMANNFKEKFITISNITDEVIKFIGIIVLVIMGGSGYISAPSRINALEKEVSILKEKNNSTSSDLKVTIAKIENVQKTLEIIQAKLLN